MFYKKSHLRQLQPGLNGRTGQWSHITHCLKEKTGGGKVLMAFAFRDAST